jgi:hypothetical protein
MGQNMSNQLELIFRIGKLFPGDDTSPPVVAAHISLARGSKLNDPGIEGKLLLTPTCHSFQELEEQIALLHAELDRIKENGKLKFTEFERRESKRMGSRSTPNG